MSARIKGLASESLRLREQPYDAACRVCGAPIVAGSFVWRWQFRSTEVGCEGCGWFRSDDAYEASVTRCLLALAPGAGMPSELVRDGINARLLLRLDDGRIAATACGAALLQRLKAIAPQAAPSGSVVDAHADPVFHPDDVALGAAGGRR